MLRYNKWMRMVSIVALVAGFGFLLSLVDSAEATQSTVCPWDLNGDKTVDDFDLEILLFCWGSCCGNCCAADFDSSGDVGVSDLLDLLDHWGDCP